jgi:predicted DNA binding CopG/RHH family protein
VKSKTYIRLSEDQIKWLKKEAARVGNPVATLIRQAVDDMRERRERIRRELGRSA